MSVLAHSDQQGAAAQGDVHRQDAVALHCVVYPQPKVVHIRDLCAGSTLWGGVGVGYVDATPLWQGPLPSQLSVWYQQAVGEDACCYSQCSDDDYCAGSKGMQPVYGDCQADTLWQSHVSTC